MDDEQLALVHALYVTADADLHPVYGPPLHPYSLIN